MRFLMIPALLLVAAPALRAQTDPCAAANAPADHATMDHAAHQRQLAACEAQRRNAVQRQATEAGNAAFAAIAEIVALLRADSTTDWSRVNLEALREHLRDMDDAIMHATVEQRQVPGGLEMRATGTGRTSQGVRRLAQAHAAMLANDADYQATAAEIPGGVRLIVTARRPGEQALVARIRGLGWAGLLAEGDHHTRHHLALARGDGDAHRH